jgi:hypothetical protein
MAHCTIGRLQVLYWPRPRLWFVYLRYSGVYTWILYLWPFEVRWFAK